MNRPELYKKTVDILYKAYFDDTLERGNCYACAVGNIIAANLGREYEVGNGRSRQRLFWSGFLPYASDWVERAADTRIPNWFKLIYHEDNYDHEQAMLEIKSTGYSISEVRKIEQTFESAPTRWEGYTVEEEMFNGLSAVLDALAQIHEVTDNDLITTNSKRFSDHYKTRSLCATNATSSKPL